MSFMLVTAPPRLRVATFIAQHGGNILWEYYHPRPSGVAMVPLYEYVGVAGEAAETVARHDLLTQEYIEEYTAALTEWLAAARPAGVQVGPPDGIGDGVAFATALAACAAACGAAAVADFLAVAAAAAAALGAPPPRPALARGGTRVTAHGSPTPGVAARPLAQLPAAALPSLPRGVNEEFPRVYPVGPAPAAAVHANPKLVALEDEVVGSITLGALSAGFPERLHLSLPNLLRQHALWLVRITLLDLPLLIAAVPVVEVKGSKTKDKDEGDNDDGDDDEGGEGEGEEEGERRGMTFLTPPDGRNQAFLDAAGLVSLNGPIQRFAELLAIVLNVVGVGSR
ncbi:hypothetical protein DFH27DRAFT_616837 [Peziza echinospora]|nr:hypothetical protein DFH27DRAFT_616837 [Peziza echinospora]